MRRQLKISVSLKSIYSAIQERGLRRIVWGRYSFKHKEEREKILKEEALKVSMDIKRDL